MHGQGQVETYSLGELSSIVGRPVAVDDALTTHARTTTDVDVLANDVDFEHNLDATSLTEIVSGASHGTATVVAGKIRYRAAAHYAGDDKVSYRVCDTTRLCSSGILNVAIVNRPPDCSRVTASPRTLLDRRTTGSCSCPYLKPAIAPSHL